MSIEAMKLALEALEAKGDAWVVLERKAKEALRQAIEQAEKQEPVASADDCRIELVTAIHMLSSDFENALYAFRGDTEARKSAEGSIAHARGVAVKWNRNGRTSPPPRQPLGLAELFLNTHHRKPLLDEDIWALHDGYLNPVEFARAIEAAHGIKE
jgi:hypothetical protein